MITAESKPKGTDRFFVIRPNASLGIKGAKILFAVIVFISLLVILRFVLIGAWMVVPFTVLEVAFFGFILRLVLRSNRKMEMISVVGQEVRVVKLDGNEKSEWCFNSYWTRIELNKSYHHWYPSKLFICSHGRSVELADCLTESEREALAEVLKESIFSSRSQV